VKNRPAFFPGIWRSCFVRINGNLQPSPCLIGYVLKEQLLPDTSFGSISPERLPDHS